jgi:hypothetical protein
VIQLDPEVPNRERVEYLARDDEALRVGHHPPVRSRDVEVALVELAIPSPRQRRLVATVYLPACTRRVSPPSPDRDIGVSSTRT